MTAAAREGLPVYLQGVGVGFFIAGLIVLSQGEHTAMGLLLVGPLATAGGFYLAGGGK